MQSGTVTNFHASAGDAGQLSEMVSKPSWRVRYEPLAAGAGFHHSVNICANGSLIALRTEALHGFRASVEMDVPNSFELHFVETGCYESITDRATIRAGAGQAYLLRDVHRHRIVSEAGTRQLCLSIPVERCARLLSATTDDPWSEMNRLSSLAEITGGPLKTLHALANLLIAGQAGDHPLYGLPLAAALIEEAFIGAFVEAWPGAAAADLSPKPARYYIRRAVDWMEAHPADPIRLEELAGIARVSVRTLQVGFRRELGISPLGYLIRMRLQHVHRELLAGDRGVTIEEIASRWGFRHMGDFSTRYRRMFGHPPSETRRRRR